MRPQYEIVVVVDEHWLIDSESYQRAYRARRTPSLRPGVYIALWAEGVTTVSHHDAPKYLGPFLNRTHAELVVREARIDRLAEQRTA